MNRKRINLKLLFLCGLLLLSFSSYSQERVEQNPSKSQESKEGGQALFDLYYSLRLFRSISNDQAIFREPVGSIGINLGYQNRKNDLLLGGFTFYHIFSYEDDVIHALGIGGKIGKRISGSWDAYISPGIFLLSSDPIRAIQSYRINLGVEKPKSLGVYAELDILKRTIDLRSDPTLRLGLKIMGKNALYGALVVAVLTGLLASVVSGST